MRHRIMASIAFPVLVIAITMFIAETPRYRYSLGHGRCLHDMVYVQKGDIDYVAIGGSRMFTGFDPQLVEDLFRSKYGRDVVAYSLAKGWYGPDYSYPMLRDLFSRPVPSPGSKLLPIKGVFPRQWP